MRRFVLLSCFLLLGMVTLEAQTDSANVTFNVNMKVQILKGNFAPATDQVTLPGDFDNWLNEPPANSTKTMTDSAPVDSIYTKILRVKKGQNYGYKFNIGLGWDGKDEPSNRSFIVFNGDTTVNFWFKDETMPSGDSAAVTFEVNMKLIAKSTTGFTSKKVYVAGSFTDWQNGAWVMSDANTDSIYTVTGKITSAQLIQYKFVLSADSAKNGTWETVDNRKTWIVDGPQTISKNWNDVDPNVTLASGNILFTVDMSVVNEIGIYDPVKDSVRLYGSFNGWNAGGDPLLWKMNQDVNPLLWFISVPFNNAVLNSAYNFKYFVELDTTKAKVWADGWERPVSQGGGNRDVTFLGQPSQELTAVYYDDIKPDYVIPNNTNLQVKFRVNMKGATAPAVGFIPGTDKVYWIGEMPSFVYTQGWTDSDTMKVLELTDANADSIYEATLNVADPSFNVFEYRYAFVHGSAWTQEASGFGDNAYRVRYVGQSSARTFPVNPWTMPLDAWNGTGVQPQETDPYVSLTTLVRDDQAVAMSYQLSQNFPNPFNPSTTISFSILSKEHVMLKVFNILGQEVATLVNEELPSGTYKMKFDASKLVSGVYFYRINAGSFSEVKRMVFLK